MSQDKPSGSFARPPLDSIEPWIIAPDLHLGPVGRVREVWRYRRVFMFFATKAVQTLYRNTRMGVAWLLVRPLAPVLVGTLIYGSVMDIPSLGIPYFLFFTAGSIMWSVFAEPVHRGSRAIESNRQLLKKLYLPRVILPAGQLVAGLVEPLVLLGVFAVAVCYYGWTTGVWHTPVSARLPAAAASMLVVLAFAFAVTLCTSVMQARARDVRYIVGYILSFWFFLTPVVYPLAMIPGRLRWLATLNPMTAPVETFKWAVLGAGSPTMVEWVASAVLVTATLWFGLWFFGRAEGLTVDNL
jgi:lipopolysaccharide transport system permease protein